MPSKLEIDILANTASAKRELQSLTGEFQKFGNQVGTALTVAAAAGVAALGAELFRAVQAASEAQNVLAQTNAVIASTGGAAGVSAQQAQALAAELQKITTFSDETILSAENLLLTFTRIGSEVFPEATKAVLNMSEALGQDTKSSAIQLGKALNDPIAGLTALRRVGVAFSEEQKELIETMVESGNVMGAQKLILKELDTEFGNAAEAAGSTMSGQLKILQNMLNDVEEEIGAALMPTVAAATTQMLEFLESDTAQVWKDNVVSFIGSVITEFGGLMNTIATLDLRFNLMVANANAASVQVTRALSEIPVLGGILIPGGMASPGAGGGSWGPGGNLTADQAAAQAALAAGVHSQLPQYGPAVPRGGYVPRVNTDTTPGALGGGKSGAASPKSAFQDIQDALIEIEQQSAYKVWLDNVIKPLVASGDIQGAIDQFRELGKTNKETASEILSIKAAVDSAIASSAKAAADQLDREVKATKELVDEFTKLGVAADWDQTARGMVAAANQIDRLKADAANRATEATRAQNTALGLDVDTGKMFNLPFDEKKAQEAWEISTFGSTLDAQRKAVAEAQSIDAAATRSRDNRLRDLGEAIQEAQFQMQFGAAGVGRNRLLQLSDAFSGKGGLDNIPLALRQQFAQSAQGAGLNVDLFVDGRVMASSNSRRIGEHGRVLVRTGAAARSY